jgi:hypothetical protein
MLLFTLNAVCKHLMNRPMNKKTFFTLLLPGLLLQSQIALANDSGEQALEDTVGASDYFKVSCSSNGNDQTDHLGFKIIDSSPVIGGSVAPQLINVHFGKVVSKNVITDEGDLVVEPGDTQEFTIPEGNGTYNISLDTAGTNLDLKTAQKYTIQYRCLNSDGVDTTSSAAGLKSGKDTAKTIKNNKTAKYTVKCSAKKKISPADTASLYFKIVNTSSVAVDPLIASLPVLNAQVAKVSNTLNTTDIAGDLLYSREVNLKGGDGDYFISVNNTGTDADTDNSKQYSFQYSCLNSANIETATGAVQLIQNQ